MKNNLITLSFLLCTLWATSQTPITAVDTTSAAAGSSFSYVDDGITYNWGTSPNNSVLSLNGFTAGVAYTYATAFTGNIKLRRVDNVNVTGNYSVEWVEAVTNGTTFNMFPDYQSDLASFLNNHVYNKGTDNLFDNTAPNSNNVERFDWILTTGYSTPTPDKVGFAIFDKGAPGTHDPFCIAAITSVDGAGDPLTYSNIVRVGATQYGDAGPSVTYRIVKGLAGSNLLDAGNSAQDRAGVLILLQDLGIAANTTIYGYSLFSGDLPLAATPANLLDYTNQTYFPLTTQASGGLDLIAVTGINIASSVVPLNFLSFNAVENNNIINLKWAVENGASVQRYDIERSDDGINYFKINEVLSSGNFTGADSYSLADNVSSVISNQLYYRIKQYERNGSYYYSKAILVRRNNKASSAIIYPNPVKGPLYINIGSTTNDKAIISIFNSAGSQVILQREPLANGNNSITIEGIGKLSNGVYQLSIKWMNLGKTITRQFSKQ